MSIFIIDSAGDDFQPIDEFALTRSLAWNGHVRIGSSEFIDTAGPARPWSAKNDDQCPIVYQTTMILNLESTRFYDRTYIFGGKLESVAT